MKRCRFGRREVKCALHLCADRAIKCGSLWISGLLLIQCQNQSQNRNPDLRAWKSGNINWASLKKNSTTSKHYRLATKKVSSKFSSRHWMKLMVYFNNFFSFSPHSFILHSSFFHCLSLALLHHPLTVPSNGNLHKSLEQTEGPRDQKLCSLDRDKVPVPSACLSRLSGNGKGLGGW